MPDNAKNLQMGKPIDSTFTGLYSILDSSGTVNHDSPEGKLPEGLAAVLEKPQSVTDAPMVVPEIQKAIVAFVDMLGTSTLMENIKEENAKEIYMKINGIAEAFQHDFNEFSKRYEIAQV
jgi:hypothetical protein